MLKTTEMFARHELLHQLTPQPQRRHTADPNNHLFLAILKERNETAGNLIKHEHDNKNIHLDVLMDGKINKISGALFSDQRASFLDYLA